MTSDFLFTSESVSEGHPDKVADQISDAVLDAILTHDPRARVAAETLVTTGLVVLAGEITTTAVGDYPLVARETIKRIGYDNTQFGLDYRGGPVLACYHRPSADLAPGADEGRGVAGQRALRDQPARPLRGRRAARRLWTDWPQDHRRHVRWRLPARRRRFLGQGPIQGRPFGCLRGSLRGEERGGGGPGAAVPDPGQLRDRGIPAGRRDRGYRRRPPFGRNFRASPGLRSSDP